MQRNLRIKGIVQGVGFRPYVWRLAQELALAGWVRNDAAGVEILVQGERPEIETFTSRLPDAIPPLAQIHALTWQDLHYDESLAGFSIIESRQGAVSTMIGHDTAVCPDCLAELFEPADRRYRYPFINCTHCGPRYTLTRQLPYDRAQTSMAPFALCPDCDREYHDPSDRRFHAEPTACPACGPRLWLFPLLRGESDPEDRVGAMNKVEIGKSRALTPGPSPRGRGEEFASRLSSRASHIPDAITETLRRIKAGDIVAIKGLGGFHLACDARNPAAIQRLRTRKQRDEKPFAIMAVNLASVADWVQTSKDEIALLQSPERPVVLLRKKSGAELPGIAPDLAWLGVMLPYTPIHWLLFHESADRPTGTDWMEQPQDLLLVMTSANPNGEPLVIGNEEAIERLGNIADAILMHDRDIVARCDDSVVRSVTHDVAPASVFPASPAGCIQTRSPEPLGERDACSANSPPSPLTPHASRIQFIRRARGYTPRAIRLPRSGPPVLALGGHLKNTICITRDDEAFLSQHIGGLDNPAACNMLDEVTQHLLGILDVSPAVIAHDLHPDFFSTRRAVEWAQTLGVPSIAVQHHHAHIAAVAAEHGISGPILGLPLDGVGLGSDNTAWGGELLYVDAAEFSRLGHIASLPLPGGDRAAREPWRMAAAALHRLGRADEVVRRFGAPGKQLLQILDRKLNSPQTTSLGRWFDAAAGLLGVRAAMAYEGQAAMELEGLAEQHGKVEAMNDGWRITPHHMEEGKVVGSSQLDLLPLLARLANETDAAHGAALFHATLAQALASWLESAAAQKGIRTVALGGGCFLNHILSRTLRTQMQAAGLTVLEARQAPPNDGGLSLGQAWVALQQ